MTLLVHTITHTVAHSTHSYTHIATITGIIVEPHRKQLHITLAHQYRPDHQSALEALCRKINPLAPSNWELRLYSRDERLATAEVGYLGLYGVYH